MKTDKINILTGQFNELWKLMPEFRFWQVVKTITVSNNLKTENLFFLGDENWIKAINNTIRKVKAEKLKNEEEADD